jgi:hypothetical protein
MIMTQEERCLILIKVRRKMFDFDKGENVVCNMHTVITRGGKMFDFDKGENVSFNTTRE